MKNNLKKFVLVWILLFVGIHVTMKIKNFHEFSDASVLDIFSDDDSEEAKAIQLNLISLDDVQNTVVNNPITILSFWETWCGPCVEEMPELQKIQDGSNQVQVIGVYQSSKSTRVKRFIDKYDIRFPLYKDNTTILLQKYNVERYPTLIVLDQEENILLTKSGYRKYPDGSDSLDELRTLIQKKIGTAL